MTKHVYQKKKKKLLKLVICDDSREEDVVPESLIHDAESSPVQNSLVKSNAETTVNIDDFAETSVEDTTIHRGDSMKVSTPVKTIFTSPERQENRLLDAITDADRQNEKRMKAQSMSFTSNLKYLKAIVKEGHILFIQDVKKVREDVNLKIQELREDIGKEVSALQHDYSSLHQKFDIIADVVTKFVKLYESLVPKVAKTADTDVQSFANIN
ncbi:unnamed protein product [Lactuca saligna]|uniref:Uncharacterized protein n=1 Tax=Lactuca saligna TaxID=75948 RepID=A0AA35UPX1_LACSI|nr:unnamed protein product [Lactuca saligna]